MTRLMVDKARYEEPKRWPPPTRRMRRRAILRNIAIALGLLLSCGLAYWIVKLAR
jgi:hypothetical protein